MKYQTLYNIVFSDHRSFRWKRHFLFWLAVFIYHLIRIKSMYPPLTSPELVFSLVGKALYWGVLGNLLFTYTIVYFLNPYYLKKKKYTQFLAGFVITLALIFVVNSFLDYFLNAHFRQTIGLKDRLFFVRASMIRILGNPPLICGLFLSLKILKSWHLEQLKSQTLAKENANAELQLLKAQVHPHFLFNTLNNIYSFSLNQSPQAGILVNKLSGMLNYMIHECEEKLVPLEKELKLIQDYVGLEKVRYGSRLAMQVEIEGDYENKMIAPLLMIPFVENCFKHGASVMRGQQWIKLAIIINDDQLEFELSNSKPPTLINMRTQKGIGLANVQKRLQLLYPGEHFLNIQSDNGTFTVHFRIRLKQVSVTDNTFKAAQLLQPA